MPVGIYLGLGSDLGDRRGYLRAGIESLRPAGVVPIAVSSVWETAGIDIPEPRRFLNMVLRVATDLEPRELLDRLLAIEVDSGRVRGVRNGPRTLDLDLLLMGGLRIEDPGLCVPHPRMWERLFVLAPLAEIAPELSNPATGRSVVDECRRLAGSQDARKVGVLALAQNDPV